MGRDLSRRLAGLTCLVVWAAAARAAEPPAVVKAEPLPAWDAKFRRTDGWIGGDGAYSVPISPTRNLWLFSDTWIGKVRNGKRTDLAMVNNTVGVQDGRGSCGGRPDDEAGQTREPARQVTTHSIDPSSI